MCSFVLHSPWKTTWLPVSLCAFDSEDTSLHVAYTATDAILSSFLVAQSSALFMPHESWKPSPLYHTLVNSRLTITSLYLYIMKQVSICQMCYRTVSVQMVVSLGRQALKYHRSSLVPNVWIIMFDFCTSGKSATVIWRELVCFYLGNFGTTTSYLN